MPTVLVTGANRGLGLEFTRQYAADGWHVIACCRKPATASALANIKGEVTIEALDVANDGDIEKIARKLKGEAIDLLINNAGIYGPRSGSGTDAWLEVIRVNTIAPFRMAEAFAPHVARSRQKTIANITSVMGSIASNESGGPPIY